MRCLMTVVCEWKKHDVDVRWHTVKGVHQGIAGYRGGCSAHRYVSVSNKTGQVV